MIQFCSLVQIKVTANDNNHESDMNDTNMYQISFLMTISKLISSTATMVALLMMLPTDLIILSVVSAILNNLKSTGGASLIRSRGHGPLKFRNFSSRLLTSQINMQKIHQLSLLVTPTICFELRHCFAQAIMVGC
jgi:hypothetical protein